MTVETRSFIKININYLEHQVCAKIQQFVDLLYENGNNNSRIHMLLIEMS